MTDLVNTRRGVIDLVCRFTDPSVSGQWLDLQAMLWEWEPSVVLALFAHGPLPGGRIALCTASTSDTDGVDVLDATLLRGSRVRVVPDTLTSSQTPSWLEAVDALGDLRRELDDRAASPAPEESPQAAMWTLTGAIVRAITGDDAATEWGRAIVWVAHGLRLRDVPVLPRVDDWRTSLDTLIDAQSAAATILTVLAVPSGGRSVPDIDRVA